jgi:hypothetical protein
MRNFMEASRTRMRCFVQKGDAHVTNRVQNRHDEDGSLGILPLAALFDRCKSKLT